MCITYLIEVQSGRVHVPWEGWQAAVERWRPDLSSWLVKLTKGQVCYLGLKKSFFVIFLCLAAQKCCSGKIFSKTPLLQLQGKCSLLPQLILLAKNQRILVDIVHWTTIDNSQTYLVNFMILMLLFSLYFWIYALFHITSTFDPIGSLSRTLVNLSKYLCHLWCWFCVFPNFSFLWQSGG